jgi:putative ABC transport system ATP-binding protein
MLSGVSYKEAVGVAMERLQEVNMAEHAKQRPTQLSGGQQQKIALARALVTDPWIIMADEPTGNLDTTSGYEVVHMLAWLNRVKHRMVIMVTHDNRFLSLATRRVRMSDGRVVSDEHDDVVQKNSHPKIKIPHEKT